MNKLGLSTVVLTAIALPLSVSASSIENVGLGLNYGLFSGPTLELTYPINDSLSIRGALSSGMGLSQSDNGSGSEPDYDVKSDGGIHRLALDYRPMGGNFFLSAGYAINNFKIKANSYQSSGSVTIGDIDYAASSELRLNGVVDWDNAPMLTLGWGHSPAQGWGALFELGAIFTGAANVSLNGSGTVDGSDISTVRAALDAEEQRLKDDLADFDFLPVLQAGVTYRF